MLAQRPSVGRWAPLAVALLAVLVVPVPAPARDTPAAHGAAHQVTCKNPRPITPGEKPPVYVRATGIGCPGAVALARKVIVRAPRGCLQYIDAQHIRLSSPCRVRGYRCRSRPIAEGFALEATCRRDAKVVRFQAQY